MGMSSSQARLLTLTARMHDIEYSAQRIEAQKLQMANESRRAYEDYLNALDAKKIQYKSINNDGSITFRDATLRSLENGAIPTYEGECSLKPFLLKNGMTDEVYITPEFAEYYGINPENTEPLGTLDEYLTKNGLEKTVPIYRTDYITDYNNIVSVNPTQNTIIPAAPTSDETNGHWKNIHISAAQYPEITKYSFLGGLSSPRLTTIVNTKEDCINQSQSTFVENTFVYDGSSTTPVQYSLDGIAENMYILEALANGYDESEYTTNKDSQINSYKTSLNNLFRKDNDELYQDMANLQRFSGLLEYILKNGSEDDIKNAYNSINGDFDALSINQQLLTIATGYDTSLEADIPDTLDIDGISSNLSVTAPDLKFNGTYKTTVPALDCKRYSTKDIIYSVARLMLEEGKWPEETIDSLIDTSDKLDPIKNLSNMQYAQIARILSDGTDDEYYGFINALENGNLNLGDIPAEWEGITEENIKFSETNKLHKINSDSTAQYNYNYSKENIVNAIAHKILTKNNTQGPDQTLTEELMTNLSTVLTEDKHWVSLMTYYNTTDFDTIISLIESGNYEGLTEYINDTPEGMTVTLSEASHPYCDLEWVNGEPSTQPKTGTVIIPKIEVLASNMLAAFRKNGIDIPENREQQMMNKIINVLNTFYTNWTYSEDMLAEINDAVCEYLITGAHAGAISILYDNIKNNKGLVAGLSQEDRPNQIIFFNYMLSGDYDFVFDNNAQPCSVTYAQIPVQVDTGEKTWDTSDSLYKELTEKYYILKSLEECKFKIIDDELCNSSEFVSNWLTLNEGYLLEFDPKTQEMVDTNVAVNTNLQEVSDEKDLKKAEAKYEADMKRIDMKDRRYDTQLAALDNERNAVKQEMETVKTVAKDNVDRTFRLFS